MPQHAHAVADLEQWDADTGRADALADDTVQVLDTRTWLADLERACRGRVVIQWAMRPEVYFAQQEAQ